MSYAFKDIKDEQLWSHSEAWWNQIMGKENGTNLRVHKGFEFCKRLIKKSLDNDVIEVYSLDNEENQVNQVYK